MELDELKLVVTYIRKRLGFPLLNTKELTLQAFLQSISPIYWIRKELACGISGHYDVIVVFAAFQGEFQRIRNVSLSCDNLARFTYLKLL